MRVDRRHLTVIRSRGEVGCWGGRVTLGTSQCSAMGLVEPREAGTGTAPYLTPPLLLLPYYGAETEAEVCIGVAYAL